MKTINLILLLAMLQGGAFSQYYFRGTVTDNHGDKLQYVKIRVKSTGTVFRTDVYGGFGFTSKIISDTLLFSYDGYETVMKPVKATEFITAVLNALPATVILKRNHLASLALNKKDSSYIHTINNETYSSINENSFLYTAESPVISFSASSNRASYSNVRRFINDNDGPVPPEAVRIEEMLNYFNFQYHEPAKDSVFSVSSVITNCPWNQQTNLLLLNISAKKISMEHLPPNNIVLLVDVSGSMDMPNKLPLLKSGFRMLVKNLRSTDTVSIVTYGETVEVKLDGIAGSEKEIIIKAIDALSADGPTPGESGIKLAYSIARKHYLKNGNNRIFLGADGDFNVGLNTEKELQSMIAYQKQTGIYLTCLGVGMGNYKDSKLSILSQTGNGNFAYIDNEQEAEKVLVSELTQTLFTVADNVSVTVSFDPAQVIAYRLTGYDNDRTSVADSTIQLEGGEIGSGHSLTALFELMQNNDSVIAGTAGVLATARIQYNLPGLRSNYTVSYNCSNEITLFKNVNTGVKKTACVALFGMKLKQSKYVSDMNWRKIKMLCNANFSRDNFIENEFLELVAKAEKIYRHHKEGRRKN
ncbi:MAG: von Willebrand factor type A domain-containing protein [Ferruginibacter sp.]